MLNTLKVTSVRMSAAGPDAVESGLLGWVGVELNDTLQLDGLTLRRTLDGRLTLSYPARRDTLGKRHSYVRPLNDTTRRHIERQVFQALGLTERASQ